MRVVFTVQAPCGAAWKALPDTTFLSLGEAKVVRRILEEEMRGARLRIVAEKVQGGKVFARVVMS